MAKNNKEDKKEKPRQGPKNEVKKNTLDKVIELLAKYDKGTPKRKLEALTED